MGYRDSEALISSIPPTSELRVLNGTTLELALHCLRAVSVGDLHYEHCHGVEELHVTDEGYAAPVVSLDGAPAGLTVTSWIDGTDDHIVQVLVDAQCAGAIDTNLSCDLTITITRPGTPSGTRTDVVLHGTIVVVAAPYTP